MPDERRPDVSLFLDILHTLEEIGAPYMIKGDEYVVKEHSVLIPDQVLAELVPIARREDREVSELVNEALRRYVWEAKERKIDEEMEAYRVMHAELKQRFLGQYVAIHNGKLIDHDTDRRALSRRVRQKHGSEAVLITPVEGEPEREFLMLSPRFERGA